MPASCKLLADVTTNASFRPNDPIHSLHALPLSTSVPKAIDRCTQVSNHPVLGQNDLEGRLWKVRAIAKRHCRVATGA
jgi:hypothetical protein